VFADFTTGLNMAFLPMRRLACSFHFLRSPRPLRGVDLSSLHASLPFFALFAGKSFSLHSPHTASSAVSTPRSSIHTESQAGSWEREADSFLDIDDHLYRYSSIYAVFPISSFGAPSSGVPGSTVPASGVSVACGK
jgi:hypothetical protein